MPAIMTDAQKSPEKAAKFSKDAAI